MNATVLERAFELAKSGRFTSIDDLIVRLRAEGYSTVSVVGPMLLRQLRALIRDDKRSIPTG
jgi:hypothetical protein